MASSRRLVSSGSPLEPEIGFSRAVRSGPYVCVAGTAPIAEGGGTTAPGDVYAQSVRCLDIAEQALREAGASLADVVRTRVMLVDIGQWRQAARAPPRRRARAGPVEHGPPVGAGGPGVPRRRHQRREPAAVRRGHDLVGR